MAKVAKKILLDVPGIGRLESKPGGTFNPGGTRRSPVVTETGGVHYDEETMEASLQFTLPNLPGYLDAVRDLAGLNVNIQDDNGQSWIVTGAFTTQPSELSGGEIRVQMNGNPADKV